MSPRQREIVRYKVLKILEEQPNASQREISELLGVSLGSVNYCIQALIKKGFVKVDNFTKSTSKKSYIYMLTPSGFLEKAELTAEFLRIKKTEYKILKKEIEQLEKEAFDS